MTLQDLYDDHRAIFEIGQRLIAITVCEPPVMQDLVVVRHEMAQKIARHLANEARLALMPLSASSDSYDRALARRYTSDLLSMRQSSSAHFGRWTPEAILADPREYRLAVRAQMRMISVRCEWEESEFLPAAKRLLSGHSAQMRAVG